MNCPSLHHGGQLRQAARQYGIPLADWLDLSTGIAPWSLPLPEIPPRVWNRLPETEDGLEQAARYYYGCSSLAVLPGSQAAIQLLPRLRPPGRTGILSPCYAEHALRWQQAGHQVIPLAPDSLENGLPDGLDVLVVVNPNNPTGRQLLPRQLLDWHQELARRGGWLVVDEAFIDCTPQLSLASATPQPGLIVLRSPGKFFGLAGARLGFMLAEPALCQTLEQALGPWPVSGPSRWLARQLLEDRPGQQRQRQRLQQASQRLARLLQQHGLPPRGGTALFQWRPEPAAAPLCDWLARQAILVRPFDNPPALRLGLPADARGWARLEQALSGWPSP